MGLEESYQKVETIGFGVIPAPTNSTRNGGNESRIRGLLNGY
jgi:hypothetical protein